MSLPGNGSVLIVDDVYAEIKNLVIFLNKNHVPYFYYNGEPNSAPKIKHTGIRYVFLDIVLADATSGTSDKNKASTIATYLSDIIDKDNGPFSIFFWSKHEEIILLTLGYLKKYDLIPLFFSALEKSSLTTDSLDEFNQKVKIKLESILLEHSYFKIFTDWQHLVNKTSISYVNHFTKDFLEEANKEEQTQILIENLYKANVGKIAAAHTPDQMFQLAFNVINNSFNDSLNREIISSLLRPEKYKFNLNQKLDRKMAAKIYTTIVTDKYDNQKMFNGHIYEIEKDGLKELFLKKFFKDSGQPSMSKLCVIDISSNCDIAGNKLLQVSENNYSRRMLFGVLYEDKGTKLTSSSSPSLYQLSSLWDKDINKDNVLSLLFHFGTQGHIPEDTLKTYKYLFSLKSNVLYELQSQLANYSNRKGKFDLSAIKLED